ncbi:ACP S-malonyltransferase [Ruminiclostridium josui]|uniref:ACP S-malonyltransferase n=1 Tax=Ruminiclostridium josui TaxID=1499 RepID=UPI00046410A1|nr:ACP S-malonyltransferase [Ruminiclostridium josui]
MEKLGVIFPGTASFYAGMGKELYINYPIAMETYREIESLTGCNLTDRLFDSYCCEGFTLKEKRLSLLAAEIIGFKLWQEKYRICPECFVAEGLGIVPALVCAGAITINDAVCIIQNTCNVEKFIFKNPEYPILCKANGYKEFKKEDIPCIVKKSLDFESLNIKECTTVLVNRQIDCLLEIGPDNRLFKEFSVMPQKIIYGYFDTMKDRNYTLENMGFRKFFNMKYVIMRLLGIAASTQNFNTDYSSYEAEVVINYGKLKDLCGRLENTGVEVSKEDVCEAVKLLNSILVYKQVPAEEIEERYRMLTEETLICINDYIDMN